MQLIFADNWPRNPARPARPLPFPGPAAPPLSLIHIYIRQVIREELQEVSFVAASPVFEQAQPELTEEQQAENEKSVLDDLEMFG